MFGWFSRKTRAQEATPQEVVDALKTVLRELGDVRERVDRLEAAFKSFRGQVYAWRGKLEVDVQPAPAAADDLSDPRLTKTQVKQRLGLLTPAGVARHLQQR